MICGGICTVEENSIITRSVRHAPLHHSARVPRDFRHQFTSAWIYQLPFGAGQRFLQSGPATLIAGGWQLNAIIGVYSRPAFTPQLSFDPTNTGSGGPRPDVVGDPYSFANAPCGNHQTINCWYNPAAFAIPGIAPGQPAPPPGVALATNFGNARRGLQGPAFYNTDFSIFKDFMLKERAKLQLRGEIFNLFNTPQFALPNPHVNTATAGQITSTLHESRQIQVSVNISFSAYVIEQ